MVATVEKKIGITSEVRGALELFRSSLERHYGSRLRGMYVFGSRARDDARIESDVDVAIVLDGEVRDRLKERLNIADLAYDAIEETGVHVQGWPVSEAEWLRPERHVNPHLIREMKRDNVPLEAAVGGASPR
jgi:uncharacterized protein